MLLRPSIGVTTHSATNDWVRVRSCSRRLAGGVPVEQRRAPSRRARVAPGYANSGHPHILLATDRAPGAQDHLAFAAKLANKLGARITLYHAVPKVSLVINAPLAESPADADEFKDEAGKLEKYFSAEPGEA